MILNLIVATLAFSYLINAGVTDNVPTTPTTGTTTTTSTNGTTTTGNTNINLGGTATTTINDNPGGDNTGVGGNINGGTTIPGSGTVVTTPPGGGSWGTGTVNLQSIIFMGGVGAGIFGTIGTLAGGDNGQLWGSVSGAIGGAVAGLTQQWLGPVWSSVLGLSIATAIFVLTYAKKSSESVEFYCLPWEAPIGGDDCQLCNNFKECSEYTCKSLGQACDIINSGTSSQECIWKNPNDVNSPIIKMINVTKEHSFVPNNAVRPPATGVKIVYSGSSDGCIKPFTPLEFSFTTKDSSTGVGEPSQCKIDYNLTSDPKTAFDEMAYYVGGDNLYSYNHTEKLSLPGPNAINAAAPILNNDGEYTLYIRCRDANGNFNQDAFSVNFCVQKGPDTTPPAIVSTNIESGKPVQFNQTKLNLEVYVNEPSECKWSRTDQRYDYMENNMTCDTSVWEMNNNLVYTCRAVLSGIKDREENDYYFRCKDQPGAAEGDKNVNQQSYLYKIIGTQPLNIMDFSPNNETLSGSTDTVPVFLTIETDNGYDNGIALCYYHNGKVSKEEEYILFMNTSSNKHVQRQDLISGSYNYYFKCVDLGGNSAYNYTQFKVDVDRSEPFVIRAYRDSGGVMIVTSEEAICSYSLKDCNFEIDSGIIMISSDKFSHNAEWKLNQNYYIRCKDSYNNQPNPNVCSIIVRPSNLAPKSEAIAL